MRREPAGRGRHRGRRVVVTGLGPVTPIGTGREAFWEGLRSGRSGIGPITRFDASGLACRIAGEIRDFDPAQYLDPATLRRSGRAVHLAVAAAVLALADAGLTVSASLAPRLGVALGVGTSQLDIGEWAYSLFLERGLRHLSPFVLEAYFPNAAAGAVSIRTGAKGPLMTVSTGCSSGANAVGWAAQAIERGMADAMLAGGTEAPITPFGVGASASARIVSTRNDDPARASRPFDRRRDGLVLAEAAGVVVLEALELAQARGARIYGELTGYATTANAYQMIRVDEGGDGFARCMTLALADAGLTPDDVDLVNAHAGSIPLTDRSECAALHAVFGERIARLPVTSIKSMLGQPFAAAAALQVIASALMLEHETIAPTINYEEPDPECRVAVVAGRARPAPGLRTILMNAFGYGGSNVTLVMQRHRTGA
ncbi:MAG TPA: beta-ketoacyl-ACP synthase II [Thermodesulfobacteriota bacterium]|nr:beta-ketoacyl-ACP synthase II [Thermodesulfobacteriota bacterium]